MSSIGYSQVVRHLAGECTLADAIAQTQRATRQLARRQPQAQVELELVVGRFHVLAQLVESPVMFPLLEMGEFMNDDHAQEFWRHLLEHAGHADLAFRLDALALDARHVTIASQGIRRHLQMVVKNDLGR